MNCKYGTTLKVKLYVLVVQSSNFSKSATTIYQDNLPASFSKELAPFVTSKPQLHIIDLSDNRRLLKMELLLRTEINLPHSTDSSLRKGHLSEP
jgi:hypothetical protein